MKSAALWCCLALCLVVVGFPVGAVAALRSASDWDLDDTWQKWLEAPPREAFDAAANLTARADEIVEALLNDTDAQAKIDALGDVDMVVSGGGNLDSYYMGIHLIVER